MRKRLEKKNGACAGREGWVGEGGVRPRGWWRGEGRLVSLLLDLPSPSLQAQVTPAPRPSASLTTNHLVLITRKFSPFLPTPPPPPPPLPPSSCPTVRPSLCQGPANFILIGHRLGRGNDLPHCLHPSVHPVCLSPHVLPARASSRSLCNFTPLFVLPPPLCLCFFFSHSLPTWRRCGFLSSPVCCRGGSATSQVVRALCNFSCWPYIPQDKTNSLDVVWQQKKRKEKKNSFVPPPWSAYNGMKEKCEAVQLGRPDGWSRLFCRFM